MWSSVAGILTLHAPRHTAREVPIATSQQEVVRPAHKEPSCSSPACSAASVVLLRGHLPNEKEHGPPVNVLQVRTYGHMCV